MMESLDPHSIPQSYNHFGMVKSEVLLRSRSSYITLLSQLSCSQRRVTLGSRENLNWQRGYWCAPSILGRVGPEGDLFILFGFDAELMIYPSLLTPYIHDSCVILCVELPAV
jgi:hypothetical protein